MSWVLIDEDKCTGCAICVTRCPRCFTDQEGKIFADSHEANCILCGHCVSLCPTGAVSHSKLKMNDFAEIDRGVNFETGRFLEFLKERRSHRHFLDKKVPLKDLEILMEACRWAPTGSNVQNVEVIIYTDLEKISKLSDLAIDYFIWIGERVKKKIARLEVEGKQDTLDYQMTYRSLGLGERMTKERESGRDPIFYQAPVLMIFHSINPTSAPKDNAVLAAHTVALTARTMGLESCYIGLLEVAAEYYPPLRDELNLPPDHKVFDTMILGYPRLKFLKTVPRQPIKVRWE
jgi:nitroreductase/NAD-dependent dihydropyrimidine dehydrogenase PreA subunit